MNRRLPMTNIREILRLIHEGNLSNRQIAKSCHCSPTTIGAIIDRYKEKKLTWPEILQMDDTELESKLYPQEINASKRPLRRSTPPILRWPSTMVQSSFQPGSANRRTNPPSKKKSRMSSAGSLPNSETRLSLAFMS